MSTATSSFIAGTILLLAIVTALASGAVAAVLMTFCGAVEWAGTAGVGAFFGAMVGTLIIDDRRALKADRKNYSRY